MVVVENKIILLPGNKNKVILLPYSLRNGSMVMAKKIVFEIIADSDSTTLKT